MNPAIMLPRLLLKLFAIDARLMAVEQRIFEYDNTGRGTGGSGSGSGNGAND